MVVVFYNHRISRIYREVNLKPYILVLLFQILAHMECRALNGSSSDPVAEWLDAPLGISMEEFVRTHPKAYAGSAIDSSPVNLKNPNQDLQEIDGNYGDVVPNQPIHVTGKIYRFRNGNLRGILVTFTSGNPLYERKRAAALDTCLGRFGKDFKIAVTKQSHATIEFLAPMLVWQRPAEIVRLVLTPETEYVKFTEGMILLSFQSRQFGDLFSQSFPEVNVSDDVKNKLIERIPIKRK